MIQARGVSLVYDDHGKQVHACRSIDLDVADGEFVGILGPSGSGKSSLLYLLSGLKTPTEGHVLFDGTSIEDRSDEDRSALRLRNFGFIFQQPFLLGYLTALENVLVTEGRGKRDRAVELLDALGLKGRAHRLPHELSGGERQRVCVARAILAEPRVVFADEPTAALDHANGIEVVRMLSESRGHGALIMVTHDPTMLERADRVVRLVDGEIS